MKPLLKRDWVGLRVRSRHVLSNGVAELPAGTMFTVRRNWGGLHLVSEACEHCGIKLFINKVHEFSVVIVEAGDAAES